MNAIHIILFIEALIISITDTKDAKIYNWSTYPFIITGLLYNLINGNLMIIGISLLIFLIILFVPGMGGGDKKFLFGIFLFVGFEDFIFIVLLANVLIALSYFKFSKQLFEIVFLDRMKDFKTQKLKFKGSFRVASGLGYSFATLLTIYDLNIIKMYFIR